VENGGVVGRGVLLDYCSWAKAQNIPHTPLETQSIPLSSLLAVAKHQSTTFQAGDILFIRTGFLAAHSALTPEGGVAFAAQTAVSAIGVESSEEILKWIWDSGFSAVAGDQPAFEAVPFQSKEFSLHEWLLAGWGMPIGEFFDLEKLAEECGRLNKWSFFFSSMPLKVCFLFPFLSFPFLSFLLYRG
jgi:kynurenine formamidase